MKRFTLRKRVQLLRKRGDRLKKIVSGHFLDSILYLLLLFLYQDDSLVHRLAAYIQLYTSHWLMKQDTWNKNFKRVPSLSKNAPQMRYVIMNFCVYD